MVVVIIFVWFAHKAFTNIDKLKLHDVFISPIWYYFIVLILTLSMTSEWFRISNLNPFPNTKMVADTIKIFQQSISAKGYALKSTFLDVVTVPYFLAYCLCSMKNLSLMHVFTH